MITKIVTPITNFDHYYDKIVKLTHFDTYIPQSHTKHSIIYECFWVKIENFIFNLVEKDFLFEYQLEKLSSFQKNLSFELRNSQP